MWILILEAGAALLLLVFIVWWTMFHGRGSDRKRGPASVRTKHDTPQD